MPFIVTRHTHFKVLYYLYLLKKKYNGCNSIHQIIRIFFETFIVSIIKFSFLTLFNLFSYIFCNLKSFKMDYNNLNLTFTAIVKKTIIHDIKQNISRYQ
jgi:hypothetical protein